MPRLSRVLLALVFLASATFARADALRLLEPANGATLRGGSLAELHWSADELPADAEEWEAFLSIDGGRYYGFRVTPHLDIELRRFTFIVPNFDTKNARILIRAGDEEHETEFDSESSFAIVRDPNLEPELAQLEDLGRGEAARKGDPDVLSWADGERNGSAITHEIAPSPPPPSLGWSSTFAVEELAAAESEEESVATPLIASTRVVAHVPVAHTTHALPKTVDLLLLCRRRNI
ncbi:MAG TPA: hypothetical protein VFV49_10730 [Thermoanaerobaculia bacterium]|nr:hypothetical protein [Thermoanaerobaculia bacterium]